VQRDIEEYLDQHNWYYERRKNYYKNIGKPPERFVTLIYLASGYVALVMKKPSVAAGLRSRFMRNEQSYETVFSEKTPLHTWVTITEILKRTESLLQAMRSTGGSGENFMKNWRNLVAFLAVARSMGRFSYSVPDLLKFDINSITAGMVKDVWSIIQGELGPLAKAKNSRNPAFVAACCTRVTSQFGITGVEVVGKRFLVGDSQVSRKSGKVLSKRQRQSLTNQFLDQVDAELPAQPWKPGVHQDVAGKLDCLPKDVSLAIARLVELGRRNHQLHGVVYAQDGSIISVDPERNG
jgi:hypothetical protein